MSDSRQQPDDLQLDGESVRDGNGNSRDIGDCRSNSRGSSSNFRRRVCTGSDSNSSKSDEDANVSSNTNDSVSINDVPATECSAATAATPAIEEVVDLSFQSQGSLSLGGGGGINFDGAISSNEDYGIDAGPRRALKISSDGESCEKNTTNKKSSNNSHSKAIGSCNGIESNSLSLAGLDNGSLNWGQPMIPKGWGNFREDPLRGQPGQVV